MSKRSKKKKPPVKDETPVEQVGDSAELDADEAPKAAECEPEDSECADEAEQEEISLDIVLEPEWHEVTDKQEEDEEEIEILNNFKEVEILTLKKSEEKRVTRTKSQETKFEEQQKPPSSDDHEEKKWSIEIKTHWWVAITGLSAMSAILIGLILKHSSDDIFGQVPERELAPLSSPSKEDPYELASEKWFHENMPANKKRALEIMRQYLTAKDEGQRSRLMRDPENYLKHVGEWSNSFNPHADEAIEYTWSVAVNEGRTYLLMEGKNAKFLPLKAYFVYDEKDDDLKLDWHASVGWSEMEMKFITSGNSSEMVKNSWAEDETFIVRCYLTKKESLYVSPYNDREHSAFKLTSADKSASIWGYAKRDSELDNELRRLLDHGRFVAELKKDSPVTLRVSKPNSAASSVRVDLLELLHPEWVSP